MLLVPLSGSARIPAKRTLTLSNRTTRISSSAGTLSSAPPGFHPPRSGAEDEILAVRCGGHSSALLRRGHPRSGPRHPLCGRRTAPPGIDFVERPGGGRVLVSWQVLIPGDAEHTWGGRNGIYVLFVTQNC
jgi:hypothetical protein